MMFPVLPEPNAADRLEGNAVKLGHFLQRPGRASDVLHRFLSEFAVPDSFTIKVRPVALLVSRVFGVGRPADVLWIKAKTVPAAMGDFMTRRLRAVDALADEPVAFAPVLMPIADASVATATDRIRPDQAVVTTVAQGVFKEYLGGGHAILRERVVGQGRGGIALPFAPASYHEVMG